MSTADWNTNQSSMLYVKENSIEAEEFCFSHASGISTGMETYEVIVSFAAT